MFPSPRGVMASPNKPPTHRFRPLPLFHFPLFHLTLEHFRVVLTAAPLAVFSEMQGYFWEKQFTIKKKAPTKCEIISL